MPDTKNPAINAVDTVINPLFDLPTFTPPIEESSVELNPLFDLPSLQNLDPQSAKLKSSIANKRIKNTSLFAGLKSSANTLMQVPENTINFFQQGFNNLVGGEVFNTAQSNDSIVTNFRDAQEVADLSKRLNPTGVKIGDIDSFSKFADWGLDTLLTDGASSAGSLIGGALGATAAVALAPEVAIAGALGFAAASFFQASADRWTQDLSNGINPEDAFYRSALQGASTATLEFVGGKLASKIAPSSALTNLFKQYSKRGIVKGASVADYAATHLAKASVETAFEVVDAVSSAKFLDGKTLSGDDLGRIIFSSIFIEGAGSVSGTGSGAQHIRNDVAFKEIERVLAEKHDADPDKVIEPVSEHYTIMLDVLAEKHDLDPISKAALEAMANGDQPSTSEIDLAKSFRDTLLNLKTPTPVTESLFETEVEEEGGGLTTSELEALEEGGDSFESEGDAIYGEVDAFLGNPELADLYHGLDPDGEAYHNAIMETPGFTHREKQEFLFNEDLTPENDLHPSERGVLNPETGATEFDFDTEIDSDLIEDSKGFIPSDVETEVDVEPSSVVVEEDVLPGISPAPVVETEVDVAPELVVEVQAKAKRSRATRKNNTPLTATQKSNLSLSIMADTTLQAYSNRKAVGIETLTNNQNIDEATRQDYTEFVTEQLGAITNENFLTPTQAFLKNPVSAGSPNMASHDFDVFQNNKKSKEPQVPVQALAQDYVEGNMTEEDVTQLEETIESEKGVILETRPSKQDEAVQQEETAEFLDTSEDPTNPYFGQSIDDILEGIKVEGDGDKTKTKKTFKKKSTILPVYSDKAVELAYSKMRESGLDPSFSMDEAVSLNKFSRSIINLASDSKQIGNFDRQSLERVIKASRNALFNAVLKGSMGKVKVNGLEDAVSKIVFEEVEGFQMPDGELNLEKLFNPPTERLEDFESTPETEVFSGPRKEGDTAPELATGVIDQSNDIITVRLFSTGDIRTMLDQSAALVRLSLDNNSSDFNFFKKNVLGMSEKDSFDNPMYRQKFNDQVRNYQMAVDSLPKRSRNIFSRIKDYIVDNAPKFSTDARAMEMVKGWTIKDASSNNLTQIKKMERSIWSRYFTQNFTNRGEVFKDLVLNTYPEYESFSDEKKMKVLYMHPEFMTRQVLGSSSRVANFIHRGVTKIFDVLDLPGTERMLAGIQDYNSAKIVDSFDSLRSISNSLSDGGKKKVNVLEAQGKERALGEYTQENLHTMPLTSMVTFISEGFKVEDSNGTQVDGDFSFLGKENLESLMNVVEIYQDHVHNLGRYALEGGQAVKATEDSNKNLRINEKELLDGFGITPSILPNDFIQRSSFITDKVVQVTDRNRALHSIANPLGLGGHLPVVLSQATIDRNGYSKIGQALYDQLSETEKKGYHRLNFFKEDAVEGKSDSEVAFLKLDKDIQSFFDSLVSDETFFELASSLAGEFGNVAKSIITKGIPFILKNPQKDLGSALLATRFSKAGLTKEFGKGVLNLKDSIKGKLDPTFESDAFEATSIREASGGGFVDIAGGVEQEFDSSSEGLIRSLKNTLGKTAVVGTESTMASLFDKSILTTLRSMNAVLLSGEDLTRDAQFVQAKKEIQAKYPDLSDQAVNLSAMNESVDLIDYARVGLVMRHINKYFIFSNSMVQGLSRFARTLNNDPNAKFNIDDALKNSPKLILGIMGIVALKMSARLLNYLGSDEPEDSDLEYTELPNYKSLGLNINYGRLLGMDEDLFLTLYGGFEGPVIADGITRFIDQQFTGNPGAFAGYLDTVKDSLSFMKTTGFLYPTMTVYQAMTNFDLNFGNTISKRRETSTDDRNSWTTRNASNFARQLEEEFDLDAKTSDFVIRDLLAYWGKFFVNVNKRTKPGQSRAGQVVGDLTGSILHLSPMTSRSIKKVMSFDKDENATKQEKRAFRRLSPLVFSWYSDESRGSSLESLAKRRRTLLRMARNTLRSLSKGAQ